MTTDEEEKKKKKTKPMTLREEIEFHHFRMFNAGLEKNGYGFDTYEEFLKDPDCELLRENIKNLSNIVMKRIRSALDKKILEMHTQLSKKTLPLKTQIDTLENFRDYDCL